MSHAVGVGIIAFRARARVVDLHIIAFPIRCLIDEQMEAIGRPKTSARQ